MSSDSRRVLVQSLIEKERASGNPVDRDHGFVALAEAWGNYEIDMPEFRRRYGRLRGECLEHRRRILTTSMRNSGLEGAFVSDDEFLVEIASISNADERD